MVTASQGSILKPYRQVCIELEGDTVSFSRAVLTKFIRKQVLEIAQDRKKKPVLMVDQVSLLKLPILAELHTITQFQEDSKPILPIILAGRNNLADLLIYRISLPLASRVVARSHLAGGSLQDMQGYLLHHLKSAGVKQNFFSDPAVIAIQQGRRRPLPKGQPPGPRRDHSCRRGAKSGRLPGVRPHRRNKIDQIK